MASTRGKDKDGGVTSDELKAVEYQLQRTRQIEENSKKLAIVRERRDALRGHMEATQPPNKKRKASSRIPDSRNEQRVLRPSARKDDPVDSGQQPPKEVIHELDGNGNGEKKGGRKITQKLNIYSRQTKSKIKIPFNELGQPYGADATEFANFIGTLVRKHISPAKLDWRDVELEAQKSLVWDHLQAFYELDSTALS
ncbi:uncharacterized protein LOC104585337 [Brachypodium distachyon]|uniref:uncharacterized protein LOC104585337 n=1 Tax=Brachypodium distachyon TaxID=15368 RepID=UPI00052FEC58|nr:uncharacterized protein LOC104585337 [Brachypodium distachyon]|eukprot:XP_010239914.1 uncharacterized protein LOC104585337 [Brachypodium distachyon]